MISKLTLIRHGPIIDISHDIYIGTLDFPLDENGFLEVINASSLRFCNKNDDIYSSPLSRSLQTAKKLFPCNFIHIDERLKERHLGEWEGCQKSDMRLLYPGAFLPSGKINPHFTPPRGESIDSVLQ